MGQGGEELSFDDAQILRLESDAIKGHTGKLILIGGGEAQLNAEAFRARIAERIGGTPRLSERVEQGNGGSGATWVECPADLAWHVADAGTGSQLSEEELRLRAGELMAERLDHDRPLWRIDVLPVRDGRTALMCRIHHAMADGISAMRLLGTVLWDDEPGGHGGGAKPANPAAKQPGQPTAEKERRGRRLFRLPGTMRREFRRGPDTVLDRHIGGRRELAWSSHPLALLKQIEHAAGDGVKVNDVVLAVLAGGLRDWLPKSRPSSIRAQVPVSLHARTESSADVGNRDSFFNIDLPLDEPDALTRLRAINAESRERKLDHDAETLYSFFHALGRFRPLYRGITRVTSGPREFALSVSNVPGPRTRPTVLGHAVEELASFAEPADRHALRIAAISLDDQLAFGLCSDPDAVEGLSALADGLDRAVEELKSAIG